MREELMKKSYEELMKIFERNIQEAKVEVPSVKEHYRYQAAANA